MMGIGTMITAAAVALGPVFGGIVTELLNWRWIFIISIFLAIISALREFIRLLNLINYKKFPLNMVSG